MRLLHLGLALALLTPSVYAQQASPWQGEWGSFKDITVQQGRRLTIQDCAGNICKFTIHSLERRSPTSSYAMSGTYSQWPLTLQSDTLASATLPGETNKPPCVLHLTRSTSSTPVIQVAVSGLSCTTYYSNNDSITMAGAYPLRSRQIFAGTHADECLVGTSPSDQATCLHPEVAHLEDQWLSLADEYPLEPVTRENATSYPDQQDTRILKSCDPNPDPAGCLTARYTADITAMQARKDKYLNSTEARGDVARGGEIARSIAGTYRNRMPNGDVQGDSYTTTDTLTLRPVGPASLHFDVELNFFNGHTCSLSGGALFRQNGSFVFDDKPENASPTELPLCHLAIIPTATGIRFKDITGGCKAYCGARGGWDDSSDAFTFKQRRPLFSTQKAPSPKP